MNNRHTHTITRGDPMTRVMVRYKVKPDQAARNEQLVRAVYDELHRTGPAGFRYATFQLDDGLTFIHLASNESGSEQSPLAALESFKRFQAGIADRCDEPPVVMQAREIGSFRAFDS
jgi:hypothetical protein